MNHYSATSLNTNPAPIAASAVKRIPLTEDQFAFVLGVTAKPKPKAKTPRKNAAEGKVQAVLFRLRREGKPMAASVLGRAVGCSTETARVCCRELVEGGLVTKVDGPRCYWKIRGEGDPQVIEAPKKEAVTAKNPKQYATHQLDVEIYEATTQTPATSRAISERMASNPDPRSIAHRLCALRDGGFLQLIEGCGIRTWGRTGKALPITPRSKPKAPRVVAGIPVATATARNGAKVSLPAFGGASND